MNIDEELKKEGIEVTEQLTANEANTIAISVARRICETFTNYGLDEAEIINKLANLKMYKAKIPEGMSEASYYYKNTSIYFNCNIPNEDLEEFAVHECIHYLQEVKDKKNKLIRMGLSEYSASKVTGEGLNEAAVQLMASKIIGIEAEEVKYYGLSFETNSPSYYPIECCLVNELAYLLGEDLLFESTINSNDTFKNKFINEMSIKTYLCVQNALDNILEAEENIVKLNNKIFALKDDVRNDNMAQKISELKSEILLTFLKTQNLIISSYFNNNIKKIKNLEQVENFRRKLYNLKDYLGATDGYTFYHDFYVEKMAELEHIYNVLENGGETALQVTTKKESLFAIIVRKIKELFVKKDTIEN